MRTALCLAPVLLAVLAACSDWKDLPPPIPDTGPPPSLLPLEQIPPAPDSPPDTGADLIARADALRATAGIARTP